MTRIAPPLTSTVSWTVLYRFFNGHGRGGSTETLLVSQPGPCALTGPELVGIMLPLHRPDRVRLGDCKGNSAVTVWGSSDARLFRLFIAIVRSMIEPQLMHFQA